MNELYAEAGVKRVETPKTYAIRALLILIAVIAFLFSIQSTIMLFIAAIIIVAVVYTLPKLKVEYEYVYCDGQLDFDKIMGNSKRKTAMTIDFSQVEIMAPQGSHSLDGYTYVKSETKDYSSLRKDVKPYVIVVSQGEKITKILFEPNTNMINCIKTKYPRKVVEY